MPGFITHFVFGKEGFKDVTEGKVKEAIRKYRHVYNIGLQGPDIFFYFPGYVLISKKNLGTIMHRSEVNAFFSEMLNYMKKTTTIDREILTAYVAGFLGHQTLDSSTHPYIYFFTDYKEGEKGYFARHAKYETDIDYYMSKERLKMHAYYFDMGASVKLNEREYKVIGNAMSEVCSKLYKVRANSYVYGLVARGFNKEISLFKDASGNKIRFVSRLEQIIMGHEHFTPLIIKKNHKLTSRDILNFKKQEWSNYWDSSIVSTRGFLELFEGAKKHYVDTIDAFERCLNVLNTAQEIDSLEKNKEEFLKKIGNKSYRTGLSYQ